MSKNEATATNGNVAKTGNGKTAVESSAPEGWMKVKTDRGVFSAERGKGGTVQGWMLGLQDMPPVNGKPWRAFIVRLTAPCVAKGRDGAERTYEPGEEVYVPANHQLSQHLGRAAAHAALMFEVLVKPSGAIKTAAGSMITFDIHVNPSPRRREGGDRLLAMNSAPAELAERSGAAADEPPF